MYKNIYTHTIEGLLQVCDKKCRTCSRTCPQCWSVSAAHVLVRDDTPGTHLASTQRHNCEWHGRADVCRPTRLN